LETDAVWISVSAVPVPTGSSAFTLDVMLRKQMQVKGKKDRKYCIASVFRFRIQERFKEKQIIGLLL
jgi:hypothetical protein